jgi:hypothetical protein
MLLLFNIKRVGITTSLMEWNFPTLLRYKTRRDVYIFADIPYVDRNPFRNPI